MTSTSTRTTAVRPSPIHGRGLFALATFRPGDVVAAVEGEIVLRESASKYAIPMTGRRSLLLTGRAKFVNSAAGDTANVVIDVRRGVVVATKDISPGDELLSRYQGIFG